MKDLIYTKQQMKELVDAEEYFNSVVFCQYKRQSPITLNNKVTQILNEVTGSKHSLNSTCPKCVYNIFLDAGKLYFKSKEYYDNLRKINNEKEKADNNNGQKSKATVGSKRSKEVLRKA